MSDGVAIEASPVHAFHKGGEYILPSSQFGNFRIHHFQQTKPAAWLQDPSELLDSQTLKSIG